MKLTITCRGSELYEYDCFSEIDIDLCDSDIDILVEELIRVVGVERVEKSIKIVKERIK